MTRRFKIEGSDRYLSPSWLPTEMAWANSYGKPIVTLVEDRVDLEGFPNIERYERFNRDSLMKDLPKITKFLLGVRDLLTERDIASSVPSPILIRNLIDSTLEIWSKDETLFGAQVFMTALSDNLATCHHSSTLDYRSFGLSVKCKTFKFAVIEKPKHVSVTHNIERHEDDQFLWKIIFDPPLAEGERVKYYYKCVGRNSKPYTLEEAEKRVSTSGFPFSEPVAFSDWFIMYPTERLRLEVSFPDGYIVKSPRIRVDIGSSGNVSKTEMQRLQENKCFEVKRLMDRIRLILDVPKPYWGYKYWILWTPPSKSELPLRYGGGASEEEE